MDLQVGGRADDFFPPVPADKVAVGFLVGTATPKLVKVPQELLRHANSRITLDIYQRTVTDERRAAQELVFKDLLGNQNLETRKHPESARKEGVPVRK